VNEICIFVIYTETIMDDLQMNIQYVLVFFFVFVFFLVMMMNKIKCHPTPQQNYRCYLQNCISQHSNWLKITFQYM